MNKILRAPRWAYEEIREKLDVRGTIRQIRALGAQYGRRFMIAAALWEVIESLVIPALLLWKHRPVLAAMFLVFHLEPVVYPVLFFSFRTYDRMRGRIPWEPERAAMSSSYRTLTKITLYRLVSVGLFFALLDKFQMSQAVLGIYSVIMTLFIYVHERLWHDSNWGITADDEVEGRRVVAKALTYRAVSLMVMAGVFKGLLNQVPWGSVGAYQAAGLGAYLALEAAWARSAWGISSTAAQRGAQDSCNIPAQGLES